MSELKVLLCGHTGGRNRGCEAIVRTTASLLNSKGIDCKAMTFDITGDKNVGLDNVVELIEYPHKNSFIRAMSLLHRKVLHDNIWGSSFYHKNIITSKRDFNMIFNVGGDTYCYGIPWISIAMNIIAKKEKCPTVFWGCSIDESIENNNIIQEDINNYSYIVARETFSYELLKKYCKNSDHVKLACDPAFHLEPVSTKLMSNFQVKNTVGINISPVMVDMNNIKESMIFKNVCCLIDDILKNSDMSVCLIPHVYQVDPESRDYIVLEKIFNEYVDSNRVSFINAELSAGELKYIISQCRFFIGSRTHSVIAAYSTYVPAIALSYSVKSRGLARDIMGSEQGYALPWKEISEETQLRDVFNEFLLKKENDLVKHLSNFIPEYKQTIIDVIEEINNECKK